MSDSFERDDWYLFRIDKVVIQQQSDAQLIFLRQVGGDILFPMAVGIYEAAALKGLLDHPVSTRPLTHELLLRVVGALQGKIRYSLIDSLLSGVFYAKIGVTGAQGETHAIDCRPSDALCTAQEAGTPIFVTQAVLEQVSTAPP